MTACSGRNTSPDELSPSRGPLKPLSANDCFSTKGDDHNGWFVTNTSVRLDADGDGRNDVFKVCSQFSTGGIGQEEIHFRVETASGSTIDRTSKWWGDRVIGASDLDQDGKPEAWLHIGGATAHNVGLVVFRDAVPVQVADPNEKFASEFLYHASGMAAIGLTVGVECADVDSDGRAEIVETKSQEAVKDDAGPGDISASEKWSYVAHRLDGSESYAVVRASGKRLSTRPTSLTWKPGLRCDGVAYGQ